MKNQLGWQTQSGTTQTTYTEVKQIQLGPSKYRDNAFLRKTKLKNFRLLLQTGILINTKEKSNAHLHSGQCIDG